MAGFPLLAIADMHCRLRALCAPTGVDVSDIATSPCGDGSPYIEIGAAYQFVIEERGVELSRRATDDVDELPYWIVEGRTFSADCDWVLAHRRAGEDPRRQLFARQEALLGRISPIWADRKAAEHNHILIEHPFDDKRAGQHAAISIAPQATV